MKLFKKRTAFLSFLDFYRSSSYRESRKDILFIIIICFITMVIFLIPTGFEESGVQSNAIRQRVRIIHVDNTNVRTIGIIKYGDQGLDVQMLSGSFKGEIFPTTNHLTGRMEMDKIFVEGEDALAVLTLAGDGTIAMIRIIDHYRTDKTIILASLFIIFTIILMGWMGIKILLTFIFTAVTLIKILYPLSLHGYDPLLGAIIISVLISAVILLLVGGFCRRGLSAFLGTASGILFTAVLSYIITVWFKIHGVVRPFAEMLLHTGYGHLNLTHLFMGGIFIAASGAMMDLSMSIAAAMDEIKKQQPKISRLQLIKSGYIVARQSVGTMSTTLLLAYSAEYTAMIMVFIAQGIPLENIINMVWVSSEIVHTLVGCFGLTLVAPFNVFASGLLLRNQN